MPRPAAKDLTERELEVMHAFWHVGPSTAQEIRDHLADAGLDRTYTTIANLVRILRDKGFIKELNAEKPFRYIPVKTYEEISSRLLGDLVRRVFHGSREQLLVRLVENRKLTPKEKSLLQEILREDL